MLEKKQKACSISAFCSATNGWSRCGEVWGGVLFADTLSLNQHHHFVYAIFHIRQPMSIPNCWRQHLRCLRTQCHADLLKGQRPYRLQRRTIASYVSPFQAKQISILQTVVDKNSKNYQENEKAMFELCQQFSALHEKAAMGGSAKAREKHIARGKMLVRE